VAKGPLTVLTLPDGIAEHWGLPPLTNPVPLTGGYHNLVIRTGDVVIRVETRELESTVWEHELLAWLAADVPEVVAPIQAGDGSTFLVVEGQIVSVLPFVEGEPSAGLDVASLLARIHARGAEWPQARARPGRPSYADLDWERNDWWDWSAVPKPPELVRAFDHVRAWIASAPSLAVTPVHGDPAQQNVLSRTGRIAGVIDWEWARLDWPALELALAAWTFAEENVKSFVRAYVDAGGPGEPDVLDEGRRLQLLVNALYSLTRDGGNTPWVDYLLGELRRLP
jgi:Ser/Thr protein kinase RdoA (MazF antagonist)